MPCNEAASWEPYSSGDVHSNSSELCTFCSFDDEVGLEKLVLRARGPTTEALSLGSACVSLEAVLWLSLNVAVVD